VATASSTCFPRIVGAGTYSRIARARVHFDGDVAVAVERLGVVLDPTESWERNSQTAGVEDPQITRLDELGVWVLRGVRGAGRHGRCRRLAGPRQLAEAGPGRLQKTGRSAAEWGGPFSPIYPNRGGFFPSFSDPLLNPR
jgi:hypothetical protein